jgi:hypothetical protein
MSSGRSFSCPLGMTSSCLRPFWPKRRLEASLLWTYELWVGGEPMLWHVQPF